MEETKNANKNGGGMDCCCTTDLLSLEFVYLWLKHKKKVLDSVHLKKQKIGKQVLYFPSTFNFLLGFVKCVNLF